MDSTEVQDSHNQQVSRWGDIMTEMGDFLFPKEVMVDIFLLFPIKKLAQLRCVCKSWNQIITSKSFVESHLNRSTSKACIFYHPFNYRPLELGLYSEPQEAGSNSRLVKLCNPPFATKLMDWNIIGSCNGVLCLCNSDNRPLIYMWNPVTNKYVALPKPLHQFYTSHVGFGVDPSGNPHDFKVVNIFADASAEVYSLQDNSWKNIVDGFPPCINISHCPHNHPVFVNGCVHWCARVSCYQDPTCPWLIISFDFTKEIFQKIMLPDNLSNGDGTKFLNVLNGRLCVFAAYNNYIAYELWEMMEYGVVESWTRKYRIEKPDRYYWWPLGFTRSGGIFAQGRCNHGVRTLITYQPDNNMFSCSCFLLGSPIPIQGLTFVESLVAPAPQPLTGA